MRLAPLFALVLAVPASAQGAPAGVPADPSPHTEAALVAGAASVAPGGRVDVALRLTVDPGWHVYWTNPGDSGLPVTVAWTLPAGVTAGPLRFPAPERLTLAGLTSFAHEGTVHFPVRLSVPDDARGAVQISGRAEWLVCADVCLPASQDVALALPVGDGAGPGDAGLAAARGQFPVPATGWTATAARSDDGYLLTLAPPAGWSGTLRGAAFFPAEKAVLDHAAAPDFQQEGGAWAVALPASAYAEAPVERLRGVLVGPEGAELVAGARAVEIDVAVAGADVVSASSETAPGGGSLAWMLLLAFAGGVVLNLMPCVFPILGIKVLGFVGEGARDAGALRRHGLAFGAGVVVSFWALAGLLLALRASGAALGWGFQLQSPLVVAALAALMVVLALGLFGVVELGTGLAAAGARLDRREGTAGAFLSGVLAVVVASPCTAPFMGAALGYALARPPATALVVFTALGLGMALPYVALSFAPDLVNRLPRPGVWMETLKQVLAFPLLLTAVWLVWVFGRQTGIDGAAALLFGLVAVALAVWLVGRWPAGRPGRAIARVVAVVLVGAAGTVVAVAGRASAATVGTAGGAEVGWRAFDAAEVDRLVADGRPVFVDYTAAWCLTCQVNKRTTLQTAAVTAAFERAGVVRVQADWTNRDPAITASLSRFGRSGVPLYVLYPGGGAAPLLLPEVLTPGLVLDALGGAETALAR